MTILAGFSSSRQGRAPLNLAAQISRNTGDKIIATAIVERPGDRTVTRSTTSTSSTSPRRLRDHLSAWISHLPADLDISVVVHQSTSIPRGLMELAADHDADLVVVGSSSSGLLGSCLGECADRLVHTAAVLVAIAPRG